MALISGPPAVHEDRIDAHILEQRHIFKNLVSQGFADHGIAAVFDDDGFAPQALDIRKGLNKDVGLADELLVAVVDDLIFRHRDLLLP